MLFNSYEFILAFLPITLGVFFFFAARLGHNLAIAWLVFASLFFYSWWNPVYVILILVSMLFNFGVGKRLAYLYKKNNLTEGKVYLFIGVTANLALLGYYKYANFFVTNINQMVGTDYHIDAIVLPLAISFFTFQQIAYLVDAYKGIVSEYQFSHYALFVTFFPQLIAGPIVHHTEMLPQFMERNNLRMHTENLCIGLTIFSIGLFKKAVLADGVAEYASPVFDAAGRRETLTLFEAWGGALAYTMQLYFDFSGYSDMAIGAARLFGIKLPLNFHSPYKATNITEFWRRWHMTLSRFLRDYVYVPLGGNRKGQLRRYMNLMVTMLLGGLWHGAGWTFVIWGGLHGLYLTINHGWRYVWRFLGFNTYRLAFFWRGLSWFITFFAVVVGWVFFRAADFEAAVIMLQGMSGLNGVAIPNGIAVRLGSFQEILSNMGVDFYLGGGAQFVLSYFWVISLLVVALCAPNTQQIMVNFAPAFNVFGSSLSDSIRVGGRLVINLKWAPTLRWAIVTALISTGGLLALSSVSEFLYFQF